MIELSKCWILLKRPNSSSLVGCQKTAAGKCSETSAINAVLAAHTIEDGRGVL